MLKAKRNLTLQTAILILVSVASLTITAVGSSQTLDNASLQIHVLSMGYADATILRFPSNKFCLIDTGSKETCEKLLTFLKQQGVKSLDLVVITHPHDNHYGGLESVAEAFTINKVITSVINGVPEDLAKVYKRLRQSNIPVLEVRRNHIIELDSQTKVEILHPDSITQEPNTDSLVLQMSFRNQTFLFPADIPPHIQNELINKRVVKQKPVWVMLPHHGGEISEAFADFVESAIKVISAGPHDRWKAPDPKTIARFNGGVLRTDLDGDLHFKSDGETTRLVNVHEKP